MMRTIAMIKDQIEHKDDLDKKPDGNPHLKEIKIDDAISLLMMSSMSDL